MMVIRASHAGRPLPCVGIGPVAFAVALLAPFIASACPSAGEGFTRLVSHDAEIAYRWEPATLKVSQFFAVDVFACRFPGPDAIREIILDAKMPAHGHGMNYRPAAARVSGQHFRFTGLMLHMPGTWQLIFDLVQGERRTRLSQEITLK